jgi:hypothetical protein
MEGWSYPKTEIFDTIQPKLSHYVENASTHGLPKSLF